VSHFILALLLVGCSQPTAPPPERVPEPLDPEDHYIAAELADWNALARLSSWAALPSLDNGSYQQQSSYDRETAPEHVLDLLKDGNRDMNHFVCAGEGVPPDEAVVPHVYDLDACPESHVLGEVLARIEGSGRLTRMWLTQLILEEPAETPRLRIYRDGEVEPIVQVPMREMVDGSAGDVFAPPFGVGVEGFAAWYYPVVFSEKLILSVSGLGSSNLFYHQTNFVLEERTSERPPAGAREDAAAVLASLDEGPVRAPTLVASDDHTLEPEQSIDLIDLAGPATLHQVEFELPISQLAELSSVTLDVTWDGRPAIVSMPLLDLLAASLDPTETQSLALAGTVTEETATIALRLPMPFAERAIWTLTNTGAAPVELGFSADGEEALPSEPWGHLFAIRSETLGPTDDLHPIVDLSGRGRFVGTCLLLEGHALTESVFSDGLNFLEGDELGIIDGDRTILGTGTEDYLNSAFYFQDGDLSTPFAQAWGADSFDGEDIEVGKVSACRWHVLGDAIDFQTSFSLDLEIGPAAPDLLDRSRTVGFAYLER